MNRFLSISRGMASHPYAIRSITNLPGSLPALATRSLPSEEQVRSIFVVPQTTYLTSENQPRRENEQALIFCTHGVLHVQDGDSSGRPGHSTFLRADSVLYVRLSLILLYGRLEIIGQVNDQPVPLVIEYNTVGHELLQPSLIYFLQQASATIEAPWVDRSTEQNAWQVVDGLELRYRNGLFCYALLPDEHLMGVAFQPEIRQRLWYGVSKRVVSASVLALTDRQVIVVGEEETNKRHQYGWVITYFPRSSVDGVTATSEDGKQCLRVRLRKPGGRVEQEVDLPQTTGEDWIELLKRYGKVETRTH